MFIGTTIWEGVVENNVDPFKANRVQVRILGIHSQQKAKSDTHGIPTNELIWVQCTLPVTGGGNSGVGENVRLLKGTVVNGYFRDGDNMQLPVILGVISGINPDTKPDNTLGFSDPDGVYPKESYLGESDVNKLARNEDIENTIVQTKKDQKITGVEKANGETWDEPETPYNAEYPYNSVKETESGHITELDDTPDNERVHIFHRSGTFIEVHPNGDVVKRIKGDNYEIIDNDGKVYIDGNCDVTINGKSTLLVNDNVEIKYNMNETKTVEKDINLTVNGNVNQIVQGNVDQTIGGSVYQDISGEVDQNINGNVTQLVGGGMDSHITGNYTLQVDGNYTVDVGGSISRTGTSINDSGSGAILTLSGAATLNGSTVNLG